MPLDITLLDKDKIILDTAPISPYLFEILHNKAIDVGGILTDIFTDYYEDKSVMQKDVVLLIDFLDAIEERFDQIARDELREIIRIFKFANENNMNVHLLAD